MFSTLGSTESQKKPKLTTGFLFDESFDTALNETRARRVLKETRENNIKSITHSILNDIINTEHGNISDPTVMIWPTVLHGTIAGKFQLYDTNYNDLIELGLKALDLQEEHYLSNTSPTLRQHFVRAKEAWKKSHWIAPKEILHSLALVKDLSKVMGEIKNYYDSNRISDEVDNTVKAFSSKKIRLRYIKHGCVIFLGSLVILDIDGYIELHVADYLKMMFNKALDLASTLMLTWLLSGVCYSESFYSKIITILEKFYYYFQLNGNDTYTLLKAFNGIADGLALEREEDWINVELIDNLWESLLELKGLQGDISTNELINLFKTLETPELFELGGISKLYGHPDIQVTMGLNKLFTRAQKEILINPMDSIQLANHLVEQYCKNFFQKNKRWPRVILMPNAHKSFEQCIFKNMWVTDIRVTAQFGQVQQDHWSAVYLDKNDYFDYVDEMIPILADKAIALPRSKIFQKLADPDTKIKNIERRLLLNFLFNEELPVSVRAFLKQAADLNQHNMGDVLEYLVIKLTQKEKELKIEGRFFGQSPLIERTRRVVLERNAAKLMKQYCPHQAMTLTELERLKRLWLFSQLSSVYPGHRIIQISIDFEAWNNYFRHDIMAPSWTAIIDGWYGVRYYRNLMKGFENTFYIHPNDDEFHYWYGQKGGIEGLVQYSWELVFVGMITETMERLGYPYQMLSNGDDCRLAIAIPEFEMLNNPARRVHELKVELEQATAKYGLKIKISETYSSEKLIAFGKIYQCNKSWMPALLKKGAKIHGFGNTIIPFLDQRIASCYSNAHSACGVGTVHNLLWLCAAFWHMWYWHQRKHKEALTKEQKVVMLLWPSVLGGQPIIPLYHFYVRGESDHLSIYISLYQFIGHYHPEYQPIFGNILRIKHVEDKSNISLILSDPYALNLSTIMQPLLKLRQVIGKLLVDKVKYKPLREVFNLTHDGSEKALMEVLRSLTPYPARVASELYSCTPYALKNQLTRQFESARTIFQFMLTSGMRFNNAIRLYNRLVILDEKLFKTRSSILQGHSSYLDPEQKCLTIPLTEFFSLQSCPTALAQRMRNESWGLEVEEVTYPCVTELTKIKYAGEPLTEIEERDHFKFLIDLYPNMVLKGTYNRHFSIGPFPPFLGQTTSEKIDSDFRLHDLSSPAAMKVANLIRIHAHTHALGSNIINLIEYIFHQISRLNFNDIARFIPPKQSGSITHRFASAGFKRSIMPNERPNRYTQIEGITDTCQRTRGQIGDWSINFFATKCQNICMLLSPMEYSGNVVCLPDAAEAFSCLTECPSCYREVGDILILCQNSDKIPFLPEPIRNPLITLSAEEEHKLVENLIEYSATKIKDYISLTKEDFESPKLINQACNLVLQLYMGQSELHSSFLQDNPRVNARDTVKIALILNQVSNSPTVRLGKTELFLLPIENIIKEISEFLSGWCLTHLATNLKLRSGVLISTLPTASFPLTPLFDLLIKTLRWNEWVKLILIRFPNSVNRAILDDPIEAQKYLIPLIHGDMVYWMTEGFFPHNSYFMLPKRQEFLTIHENIDIAVENFKKRIPVLIAMAVKSILHDRAVQILLLIKYLREEIRTKITQMISTLQKIELIKSDDDVRSYIQREEMRRKKRLEQIENQMKISVSTALVSEYHELSSDIITKFRWPLIPVTFLLNIFAQAGILPPVYENSIHVKTVRESLEKVLLDNDSTVLESYSSAITPFYCEYFNYDEADVNYVLSLYQLSQVYLVEDIVDQLSNNDRSFVINPLMVIEENDERDVVQECINSLCDHRFGTGILKYLDKCNESEVMDKWLRHKGKELISFSVYEFCDDQKVTITRIEKSAAVEIVRHLERPTLIDIASMQAEIRRASRRLATADRHLIRPLDALTSLHLNFCESIIPQDIVFIKDTTSNFNDLTFENSMNEFVNHGHTEELPITALMHNCFRPLGRLSSSCSKVYNILWDLSLINPIKDLQTPIILCCGDGTGGNTVMCLETFKDAYVVFNTLLTVENMSGNFITPEEIQILADNTMKDRCIYDHNYRTLNDLRNPLTLDELWRQLTNLNPNMSNFTLIINDAWLYEESCTVDEKFNLSSEITFNISKRCQLGSCLVISRFQLTPTLECFHFLLHLSYIFRLVYLVKPIGSPFLNQECYLVLHQKVNEVTEANISDFRIPITRNIRARRHLTNVYLNLYRSLSYTLFPQQVPVHRFSAYQNMLRSLRNQERFSPKLYFKGYLTHPERIPVPFKRENISQILPIVKQEYDDLRTILFSLPQEAETTLLRMRNSSARLTSAQHKIFEMMRLVKLSHLLEFFTVLKDSDEYAYDLIYFVHHNMHVIFESCRNDYQNLILPTFWLTEGLDGKLYISASGDPGNLGARLSVTDTEIKSVILFWRVLCSWTQI